MVGKEDFLPFWEAWKLNTNRPKEPDAEARWSAASQIFLAVAAGRADDRFSAAIEYIEQSREESLAKLEGLGCSKGGTVRLYRGLRGEAAIRARQQGYGIVRALEPTSFTYDRDAAVGFASSGVNDGCVCAVDLPPAAIVFVDVNGLCRDGNVHLEKEAVVVVTKDVQLNFESTDDSRVPCRKRICRTKADKAALEAEQQRLKELETTLTIDRDR